MNEPCSATQTGSTGEYPSPHALTLASATSLAVVGVRCTLYTLPECQEDAVALEEINWSRGQGTRFALRSELKHTSEERSSNQVVLPPRPHWSSSWLFSVHPWSTVPAWCFASEHKEGSAWSQEARREGTGHEHTTGGSKTSASAAARRGYPGTASGTAAGSAQREA